MDGRNGKALTLLFKSNFSLGLRMLSGKFGLAEDPRQRHGETGSMRGTDQLFGVRTWLVFEATAEPIGIIRQCAALGRDCALSVPNAPLPFGPAECRRHGYSFSTVGACQARDVVQLNNVANTR